MKTIVTGGSGFIGSHLLKQMNALGYKNVISTDIRDNFIDLDGVEFIRADIKKLSQLDIGDTVERIFHLAAIHTTPGHESWEYYDANVNGALEVVRFARRHGTRSIVFTSSISVYGPGEEPKDEKTEPAPTSDYGRSKLMAEKILEDWQKEAPGRKLIVARPAVVFGPGEGGNFTRLAKILRRGWFFYPGRRDTVKSCIYVRDLVDWLLFAETRDEEYTLFNGAYAERWTTEQIVGKFREVAFPKIREITIPGKFLKAAAVCIRLFGFNALGIHPERIEKLMISTNILPTWAIENGMKCSNRLDLSLHEWGKISAGQFE